MKLTKKYECKKCHHGFSKVAALGFIKTVMPQCPICNSNNIQSADYVEKKKKK